ncbi:MAG: hypothetical protein JST40_04855 [Armatimonadetes bacterium]|nr:hypothetical protein [Armatimonadota bacterium]
MRGKFAAIGLFTSLVLPAYSLQDGPLTDATLKAMIEGLGYTTKNLTTDPKKPAVYEFSGKTEKFNIPIATELSPSGSYVWFTVLLGDAPAEVSKHTELLKQNASIQPCFFYITSSNKLKLGIAMENRAIKSTDAKRVIEKILKDVDSTSTVWAK